MSKTTKKGTVIVTGACGSFGKIVAPHLHAAGYKVHAVDRLPWPDCPKGITFHRADILKRSFDNVLRVARPDALVHMAMIHRFGGNRARRFRVNYEGTARVIKLANEVGVRNMVFSSRTTVYGALPDQPNFLTEEHPPAAGRMLSGMQDLVDADLYASGALWRYPDTRMSVLRFVNVLGRSVNTLLQRYLSKPRVFTVAGFDPVYQVMHERDMARSVELALDKDLRGIFNVTGPGEVPLHVLIDETGGSRIALPELAIKLLKGRIGFPKIPDGALAYLKHSCTADGSRFTEATGFVPEYDLSATMGAVAARRRS